MRDSVKRALQAKVDGWAQAGLPFPGKLEMDGVVARLIEQDAKQGAK